MVKEIEHVMYSAAHNYWTSNVQTVTRIQKKEIAATEKHKNIMFA